MINMSLGFDSPENYDLCPLGSWHNTTIQLLNNLTSSTKNTYSICIENASDLAKSGINCLKFTRLNPYSSCFIVAVDPS
jgi:hypothetical protein